MSDRWNKLRALARDLRHVRPELARTNEQLADLRLQLEQLRQTVERDANERAAHDRKMLTAVQAAVDQESDNRRRLMSLRSSDDYERPFIEAEPLVSITVPTYENYRALAEVALPSILSQTYSNIEVVVVGDCAPAETAEVVARVDDSRVSYYNLNRRGPYPSDPDSFWQVAGIYPMNEARQRSRGSWILPFNDDDHLRPDAVEALLSAARETRSEVVYGQLQIHTSEDERQTLGMFPPEMGQFGWQAALHHRGLRFMEHDDSCALFNLPADWALCRRMLRIGVRFSMIPRVVTDYYPSRSWTAKAPTS